MKKTIKTFPQGGIHPHDNKISADAATEILSLPETVTVFFSQHIGAPAKPIVNPGDTVKAGQVIAEAAGFISTNIHSPVSGTIQKFDMAMDSNGYKKQAAIIKVEGDEWVEGIDLTFDLVEEITTTPDEIRQKVQAAGVVGLGGATFPSHVKLGVPEGKTVEMLLINAVECEPYLTSDYRLMIEKGREMLVGVRIALKALGLSKAKIGIEDNKPEAIRHLKELTKNDDSIEVYGLKTWYPQGGERQLVKALMDREIPPPPKGLPIDVGAVVLNAATCFAIYEAVQKNKPLVDRIVTVTGKNVSKPSNFLVRLGTPLSNLIDAAGGIPEGTGKIVNGGPMMGKALGTLDCPVTKGTGGIVMYDESEAKRDEVIDCIRCAKCVSVCPLGLEPFLMARLTELNMLERAESERITSCCECACCAYTCPSHRPLVDYIRLGKAAVLKAMREREAK